MLQECPISDRRINARIARAISIFVLILTLVYLLQSNSLYLYLLLADFTLRLFRLTTLSPLFLLSRWGLNRLNIPPRMMDEAPKRFALYLGWGMVLVMVILDTIGLTMLTKILAVLLLIFSSLEAVFEYCVGCKIYQILRERGMIR